MHDSNLSLITREDLLEISLEPNPIERPSIVTFSTTRSRLFCSHCQDIVTVLTAVAAASLFNTDLQDIQFLLSKHEIHTVRQDPAVMSICRVSLENCFEKRQTRLLDSHFEVAARRAIFGGSDD
ncbi:MAG: hypothetical protein ABL984_05040 [Pyrinomonadaceae bacterium]